MAHKLQSQSILISQYNNSLRATVPLKSKLPPLVSFTLVSRDETLVARDETLVARDETLVSRD